MITKWFKPRVKNYSSRVTLEQLEERIVLDASVTDSSIENPSNTDQISIEHSVADQGALESQNLPTQASAEASSGDSQPLAIVYGQELSQVFLASDLSVVESVSLAPVVETPLRAIVVSTSIQGASHLIEATNPNVIAISYDTSTGSPSGLLDAIHNSLGGRQIDSIGFALHNLGEGQFHLAGDYTVSPSTLLGQTELQDFWRGIGGALNQNGRIDMLTCNLAATQSGSLVISQLEQLTGHQVAASDNLTGSAAKGGDWILETGGIDLVSTYFSQDQLIDFSSVLIAEQKISASDGAREDSFGYSVSIDGNFAIVGAYRDDDRRSESGSAYIYFFDGKTWNQQTKLTASDGYLYDYFGYSVSIDGNNAIVGAHWDDDRGTESGSAYIFHFDGSSWIQQAKLTAKDGQSSDYFGYSVSISGDNAIVGSYQDDDRGFSSGSAYIYSFDGKTWNETSKLTASDGATWDSFGYSVSLDGNYAIVGAHEDDARTFNSGSAYIYFFDGKSWVEQAKLVPEDAAESDLFGISVSISGDSAIVGSFYDDDRGDRSGSAYIFSREGATWFQQAKLNASDGSQNDLFGISVGIDNNRAIVGSYLDAVRGYSSGSAYLFSRDGSTWSQQEKLTASDGHAQDSFGYAVSIDGGHAIVGAYQEDDKAYDAGAAYIFTTNLAPTDISLSSASVSENSGIGAVVGTLSSTDVDNGQSYTYTLVDNALFEDNSLFFIEGNQLKTARNFNYELDSDYLLNIRTDDGSGGSFTKSFDITVSDSNDAPGDISLTSSTIQENLPAGTVVGELSTIDEDGEGAFTYSLIDGENYPANNLFAIVGNELRTVANLDFETADAYTLRIQTEDGEGATIAMDISVRVTDASEAPSLYITNNRFFFPVGKSAGINVGTDSNILVDDPDSGEMLTARLIWNPSNGSISYSGGVDSDGVLELTGEQTAVNSLLKSIVFVTSDSLKNDTSLSVSIKDSDGQAFDATDVITLSKNFQTTVQVPDSLNATRGYKEGFDKVFLPSLRIVDQDVNEKVTVTLSLDNPGAGYLTSMASYSEDTIYDRVTGVWEYSGAVKNVNSMLSKVVFVPEDDTDTDSHIAVRITDNKSDPVTGLITLKVTPVNDQPELVSVPESIISYLENSPFVSLAGMRISDPDTGENDLTVTVKLYNPTSGSLSLKEGYIPDARISDFFVVKGVGAWSVTGTVDQVNRTLDNLRFIPAEDNDSNSRLSVEVTDHGKNTVARKEYFSLKVTPDPKHNDPVLANFIISGESSPVSVEPIVSYKEGFKNVYIPTIAVTDDDPDARISATFTLTSDDIGEPDIKIGYLETYGGAASLSNRDNVWKLENLSIDEMNKALGHLRFQPDYYNDRDATLSVVISDGNGSDVNAKILLNVNPVNDRTVFTDTLDQVIKYNEDSHAFVLKTVNSGVEHFLQVADPDTGQRLSASIHLADKALGGFSSSYNFAGVNISIDSNSQGVWSVTDRSVEEINLALANLKFIPVANNEKDTWFSVEIGDGPENSQPALYREFRLDVQPTNDQVLINAPAPVNYGKSDGSNLTELELPDIGVSEKDSNEVVKATFTVNVGTEYASLTRFSGLKDNLYDSLTGQWVYEGSLQNLNAAIKDLKFVVEDGFIIPPGGIAAGGGTSVTVKIEDGLENGTSPIERKIYITEDQSFLDLI